MAETNELRKALLEELALDAAKAEYGKFESGKGSDKVGAVTGKKSKPSADVIKEIYNRIYSKLDSTYKLSDWDEKTEKMLRAVKPEDLAKEVTFDRNPIDKTKVEFAAFRSMVNPEGKDKSWYDMDKRQLEYKMDELGYDSNKRTDVQKFFEKLSAHQTQFDRANVVEDELYSPGGVYAAMAAPTLTREAVRQSITGDFDDAKSNRAGVIDVITAGLLGGATKIPKAVASGAAAFGIDAVRQGVNEATGLEGDWASPFASGMAAGTVPSMAKYLGSQIGQASGAESMPFRRGFVRGLHGLDDPINAERNRIKNVLLRARGMSEKADKVSLGGDGNPVGAEIGIGAAEDAGDYNRAQEILRAFGYKSHKTEHQLAYNVHKKQKGLDELVQKVDEAAAAGNKELRDKYGALADATQKELDAAVAEQQAYDMSVPTVSNVLTDNNYKVLTVEDIIGLDPTVRRNLGAIHTKLTPNSNMVEKVLEESYDKPTTWPVLTREGVPGSDVYEATRVGRELLRTHAPQKASMERGMGANELRYLAGLKLGQNVSNIAAPVETAFHFTPENIRNILKGKPMEDFRESKWYQELPKDKQNAVEEALKRIRK